MPNNLSLASISRRLISILRLKYVPDDWQVHLIHRILQGYDSIFCAGTGYGKSLIFEGLAVLGGKGKLVIVISPLKALERDQVCSPLFFFGAALIVFQAEQAIAKGIDALIINEDTTKTTGLWKHARTSATMVYMSPEMALAPSFQKLWKDSRFRTRITAIVVDEAHCIAEWGGEDFRPTYRSLETLRGYTGQEIPIIACTATCPTKTFDLIWTTLGYGFRPFWGLDVGSDRPNLLYITRILENPKNPILDIIKLLPNDLTAESLLDTIPKCIFYFDSEDACRKAVQFIRKCLPDHLRRCVHAFSSNMSELAKMRCWEFFSNGGYRIICATDAAGMGCNVSDVKYIVTFGMTKSLGTISQRWGRAGRNRTTEGVCIWLVPKWAFRPQQPSTNPAVKRLQNTKNSRPLETKHETLQRAKLDPTLEEFINIGSQDPPGTFASWGY